MKKLFTIVLAALMLCCMALAEESLCLTALNVGKADALLLTAGDDVYLIDTGTDEGWGLLSCALKVLDVTHLTGVIVTHMDKDHDGGAAALSMSGIQVDGWYASWAWEKDNWEKHPLVEAAALQGAEVTTLAYGDTLPLGEGKMTVLGPLQRREDSENDNSLVLLAEGGDGSILLTGDMKYDEEDDLLSAGVIPSCTVLKVAHHGRDDATSSAFVSAVSPQIAVISTSTDESPDKKVLNVLKNAGAQIYQTYQATCGIRVTVSGGKATAEVLNYGELPAIQEGIAIEDKDNEADTLVIANHSSETADLSGWFIRSERGGELFVIPQGTTLASGGLLLIATDSSDESGDLHWPEKNVWHNSKSDAAILYDVYGREVTEAE